MLGFMGVNLMFDSEAINPIPTVVNNMNDVSVSSGIIEHLVISKGIASESTTSADYNTWDVNTIMNAKFAGTLAAGSVDFLGQTISRILIKRRVSTDVTASWVVVGQIDIDGDASALHFVFRDATNRANTAYKYGLVPVFEQMQPNGVSIEIEGNPIESEEILSHFDGVFICDNESFYRLYAGVSYGDTTINQLTGVHTTLGREYPIIVANAKTQYKSGSLSAKVVTDEILDDGQISNSSRLDMAELSDELSKFFVDKQPKILKDWNGNIWLVVFTDNPSVGYDNNWGMGVPTINGQWTEVGSATDSRDLADAGLSGYNYGGV